MKTKIKEYGVSISYVDEDDYLEKDLSGNYICNPKDATIDNITEDDGIDRILSKETTLYYTGHEYTVLDRFSSLTHAKTFYHIYRQGCYNIHIGSYDEMEKELSSLEIKCYKHLKERREFFIERKPIFKFDEGDLK